MSSLPAAGEPFGEDDFLLVAAAERMDRRFERGGFDAELIKIFRGDLLFLRAIEHARSAQAIEQRHAHIGAAGHSEDAALALAIFWNETDSGPHRGLDVAQSQQISIKRHFADRARIESEDRLRDFTAPGPDEAREADDFARANLEVDIPEFSRRRKSPAHAA